MLLHSGYSTFIEPQMSLNNNKKSGQFLKILDRGKSVSTHETSLGPRKSFFTTFLCTFYCCPPLSIIKRSPLINAYTCVHIISTCFPTLYGIAMGWKRNPFHQILHQIHPSSYKMSVINPIRFIHLTKHQRVSLYH